MCSHISGVFFLSKSRTLSCLEAFPHCCEHAGEMLLTALHPQTASPVYRKLIFKQEKRKGNKALNKASGDKLRRGKQTGVRGSPAERESHDFNPPEEFHHPFHHSFDLLFEHQLPFGTWCKFLTARYENSLYSGDKHHKLAGVFHHPRAATSNNRSFLPLKDTGKRLQKAHKISSGNQFEGFLMSSHAH